MIKLSKSQLEAFLKLAVSNGPVDYIEFLSDLKPVSELVEKGIAAKINGFYKLNKQGRDYYIKFLEQGSEFVKSIMDSN